MELEQVMIEILTISTEGARIGCGAMDWIFAETDKIEEPRVQLLTLVMALAIMQDKIKVTRDFLREKDPETDSMISEALVHFSTARAARGG